MPQTLARSSVRQMFAPQHERILDRVCVIRASDAGHGKPELLVETPGDIIRSPHFERRTLRAKARTFVYHELQQRGRDPGSPLFRQHREVVDVELVENPPEGAEPDGRAIVLACDVAIRGPAVL